MVQWECWMVCQALDTYTVAHHQQSRPLSTPVRAWSCLGWKWSVPAVGTSAPAAGYFSLRQRGHGADSEGPAVTFWAIASLGSCGTGASESSTGGSVCAMLGFHENELSAIKQSFWWCLSALLGGVIGAVLLFASTASSTNAPVTAKYPGHYYYLPCIPGVFYCSRGVVLLEAEGSSSRGVVCMLW